MSLRQEAGPIPQSREENSCPAPMPVSRREEEDTHPFSTRRSTDTPHGHSQQPSLATHSPHLAGAGSLGSEILGQCEGELLNRRANICTHTEGGAGGRPQLAFALFRLQINFWSPPSPTHTPPVSTRRAAGCQEQQSSTRQGSLSAVADSSRSGACSDHPLLAGRGEVRDSWHIMAHASPPP